MTKNKEQPGPLNIQKKVSIQNLAPRSPNDLN